MSESDAPKPQRLGIKMSRKYTLPYPQGIPRPKGLGNSESDVPKPKG